MMSSGGGEGGDGIQTPQKVVYYSLPELAASSLDMAGDTAASSGGSIR